MAKMEIQIRCGRCATHGQVDATREIPRLHYPIMYYGPLRMIAKRRRSFKCPTCGSTVTTD